MNEGGPYIKADGRGGKASDREYRNTNIIMRISEAEKASFFDAARKSKMGLSEWVRVACRSYMVGTDG